MRHCFRESNIIAFLHVVGDELYAIWSVETRDLGGLEFSSMEVGISLVIGAFALLFAQIAIFPRTSRLLGPLRTYQIGMLMSAPVYVMLPALFSLRRFDDSGGEQLEWWDHAPLWLGLSGLLCFRFMAAVLAFSASMMVTNHAVYPWDLGSVNGLSQTLAAAVRALGPFLAGSLWSITASQAWGWPLNHWLIFLLLAVGCVVSFLWALALPRSLNRPRALPSSSPLHSPPRYGATE